MDDAFKTYVAEAKRHLRAQGDVAAGFASVRDAMSAEVDAIREADAKGGTVIPEINYANIADGSVTEAQRADIRHRGLRDNQGRFPARYSGRLECRIGRLHRRKRLCETLAGKGGNG